MAVLRAVLCAAALSSVAALDVGTLRLPAASPTFDPTHPAIRQVIMRELNVGAMDVEVLSANGGLNGGVWILSDPRRGWADMVMKLRPVEPELPYHPPGEAKHLVSLASMHPGLARDPDVVFPSRILSCVDAYGSKRGDLIFMRKAPGHTLSRFINDKYYAGLSASEELMAVFESVGRQLRAFHSRYSKQHADFHSANIMIDPQDGNRVTFIDLGGMGLPIGDNDIKHLIQDMRLQSATYRPDTFLERGIHRFERAYNSAPAVHPQAHRSRSEAVAPPRAPAAPPRAPAAAPPRAPAVHPQAHRSRNDAVAPPRVPAAVTVTTDSKPKFHGSEERNGETTGIEVLWTVVESLEDALEWEHLLIGAMIMLGTPLASRSLRQKRS